MGGGGFMSGAAGTPGGANGDGKKRQRANNVVPVTVGEVLDCQGESLTVEGMEVGLHVSFEKS